MKKIINDVSIVHLDLDENINDVLQGYAIRGFKLVSTEILKDNGLRKMYLFFVKEIDE